MNDFTLDSRLDKDCIKIGSWNSCELLLMNNALVPWFILVPRTTATELFELPHELRQALEENVDALSQYILQEFEVVKINVAAIGNIVSQLHVHVIGRSTSDFCWPGVVWGRTEKQNYTQAQIDTITFNACRAFNI